MSELLIAKLVIKALTKQKKSICVAESITGGGLGQVLTQIPGASKVFVGGVITYSDELKVSELGVSKADLKKYTAVSEEVAISMAKSALKKFKTDFVFSKISDRPYVVTSYIHTCVYIVHFAHIYNTILHNT